MPLKSPDQADRESNNAKKCHVEGVGYVLGEGVINNPRSVRIDGTYAFVGLTDENGEWKDIMPYTSDELGRPSSLNGYQRDGVWLEELGPGKLVFIPDEAWNPLEATTIPKDLPNEQACTP